MPRSYHKITGLISREEKKLSELSDIGLIELYIDRLANPRSIAFHHLIFDRALNNTMKKRDLRMVKKDSYMIEIGENFQLSIA